MLSVIQPAFSSFSNSASWAVLVMAARDPHVAYNNTDRNTAVTNVPYRCMSSVMVKTCHVIHFNMISSKPAKCVVQPKKLNTRKAA